MESLIMLWSKLSPNDRERGGMCLTEERSSSVYYYGSVWIELIVAEN